MTELPQLAPILLLGAWHGINPGMGWLFAAALGWQEGRAAGVWRALPPVAAGHALAVAATLGLAGALSIVLPPAVLRWVVALLLALFGLSRILGARHPRYGGMRVSGRQLVTWSFLMASAHGAGIMLVPFAGTGSLATAGHAAHAAVLPGGGQGIVLAATALHTLSYSLVAGLAALVVYRLGLARLRRWWINLDLLWGWALVVTAVACVV